MNEICEHATKGKAAQNKTMGNKDLYIRQHIDSKWFGQGQMVGILLIALLLFQFDQY